MLIQGQSTGPSISRYYQYVLPITCAVNRFANKTEWLDSLPPNIPVDQLPHVNDILMLDMVIKVFKNPELTEELSTPVKLPVGTSIYVQLSGEKDKLSGGTIIVEDGVAKPYIGAVITHTLITKQKAVNGDQVSLNHQFLTKCASRWKHSRLQATRSFISHASLICVPLAIPLSGA